MHGSRGLSGYRRDLAQARLDATAAQGLGWSLRGGWALIYASRNSICAKHMPADPALLSKAAQPLLLDDEGIDLGVAIDALHQATAFYTAEPVVDELLAELQWPEADRRLVDPSCGDGAFLERAIERVIESEPGLDDAKLTQRVHGWEIHAEAADAARQRLGRLLQRRGRSERAAAAAARMMVTTGDFLTEGPRAPAYHCIAGNPPFLRYAHLHPILRRRYEATLPDYSRADMLHSFLDRCAQVLLPDGEIGVVTSDRWLFNANAARLREVLGETLSIAGLRQLDGDSAFYRAKTRRAGTLPRVHPVAVVLKRKAPGQINLGRDPLYPRAIQASLQHSRLALAPGDAPLLDPTLATQPQRKLCDIASVRIAPWLGSKGVFVVDQQVAAALPQHTLVPAMDTDDIVTGVAGVRVTRAPTRWAIRTQRDCEPSGPVLEHLLKNRDRMAQRGRRSQKFWVPPESFERFDLSQPHLVVPRIAKSLTPVRVPAGVLPINHNLSIVSGAGPRGLDEIEAILRDPASQEWVEQRAPRLENGYWSLTTTLLRQLPVA